MASFTDIELHPLLMTDRFDFDAEKEFIEEDVRAYFNDLPEDSGALISRAFNIDLRNDKSSERRLHGLRVIQVCISQSQVSRSYLFTHQKLYDFLFYTTSKGSDRPALEVDPGVEVTPSKAKRAKRKSPLLPPLRYYAEMLQEASLRSLHAWDINYSLEYPHVTLARMFLDRCMNHCLVFLPVDSLTSRQLREKRDKGMSHYLVLRSKWQLWKTSMTTDLNAANTLMQLFGEITGVRETVDNTEIFGNLRDRTHSLQNYSRRLKLYIQVVTNVHPLNSEMQSIFALGDEPFQDFENQRRILRDEVAELNSNINSTLSKAMQYPLLLASCRAGNDDETLDEVEMMPLT